MFKNQYFDSKSTLHLLIPSHRSLATAILVLLFIFIVIIFGCGEETIDNPLGGSVNEEGKTEKVVPMPIPYYPMTVGSHWVYRNSNRSEWTREVTGANFLNTLNTYLSHSFSYNPTLEENQLDFFQARSNIATPDKIIRPIKIGEIGITGRQEIDIPYTIRIRIEENNGNTVKRFGFFGPRTYTIDRLEFSDFTFLGLPLVPGKTWRVFSMDLRGHHNIHNFSHVLDAHSVISARINEELQTVVTPAGSFEDCLEIEYYETRSVETTEIEIKLIPEKYEEERAYLIAKIHESAATEILKLLPNISFGILWLAPGVGPVKIQDTSGISELIAFDVKSVSDQWQVVSGQ